MKNGNWKTKDQLWHSAAIGGSSEEGQQINKLSNSNQPIEPYINKTTPHQIYRMDETPPPQRQVEMRRKNIHKTIVSNGKTKKIAALAKSEREDDVERAEASTMGCDSMASSRASAEEVAVELKLVVSWFAEREREKK